MTNTILLNGPMSKFVLPNMSFINTPTEVIRDISFSSGTPISTIQGIIISTRATYPNDIIRVKLTGNFTVTTTPLILNTKMLLILDNATITAEMNATASSLIYINGGHYITIAGYGKGLLNGNGLNIKGIDVNVSGKVCIDNLYFKDFNTSGITYLGVSSTTYADAGSITRCNFTNCTTGISFTDSFNFVCTDNVINGSSSVGILVASNNADVSNNTIVGCATGIYITGIANSISYNFIRNSSLYGIHISNADSKAIVANNKLDNNTTSIFLNCGTARICYNTFTNSTTVIGGLGGNSTHLFCNIGLSSVQAGGKQCVYFNPPLIRNQHTDLIKVGLPRINITVTSGTLTDIRTALDNAHTASPTGVIVCHLNGTFVTTSNNDMLVMKQNECILLNGTITNGIGYSSNILVEFNSNLTSSFSGGIIDGQDLSGQTSLVYVAGSSIAVLDSITVKNSLGMGIQKISSYQPTYLKGCLVDNCNSRNIGMNSGTQFYLYENTSINSTYDGIDFDSFSSSSIAIKNILNNNNRIGIFIEEGSSNHIVSHNVCNNNANEGISLYTLIATGHVSKCLVSQNTCNYNNRGILVSATSIAKNTVDNTFFNNICIGNLDLGFYGLFSSSSNNYFALNTATRNANGDFNSDRDYTTNTDWNLEYFN